MIWLPAALVAAPSDWVPVGISQSALRVFVQRSSVHDEGDRRLARIRIGAAHSITGTIDLVYQDEAVDCRARTWQLLAFEARDAQDHVVQRADPVRPAAPVLPGNDGTIGGEVIRTVCAFPPARR